MSKMDRQLNSKKDKETIYEIYRACRLCGAGAGYKMPIIQNVVDLDDTDVELRQKVRDCVQIEVHQDDKMPPLICELCVDKVNDFYEFLEMCRQTNKRTRLRLGLPPQSMPRGAPDAGECILGLTEPVYVNEDSDGEPLSKQKKINPKVKVKREPELKVRLEKRILTETRPSRFTKRAPTPPRVTRHRTNSKEDNVSLNRLKDAKSPKPSPKSILKKESKNEDNSLLTPRLKRTRDKEPVKLETPFKRVKITTRTSSSSSSPQTPKSSPKILPKLSPRTATKTSKSPKLSPVRPPSPPRVFKCSICGHASKTSQANSCHLRSHTVGFTNPKLACNPCGLWFPSADDAAAHHKQHRNKSKPYNCTRCDTDFRHLTSYDEHLENNECIPFDEVPDVKCEECWHLFATNKLLEDHKCLGEDHRPGGKCSKCRRSYTLLKNLKKHELTCTVKRKGELIVDPVLLGKLKPIQIRMSRCDPLLANLKQEHYDVSNVTADFGLDKDCVYPYISSVSSLRIKSDPDGMVDIQDEIKNEFYTEEDYVHWDSEDSETDEESSVKKKVDTLANLTLKILFSKKCLGKVPKKKRRVKQEKNLFDSLVAGIEDDISTDINNIIDNLGDDDDELDGKKDDDKDLNDSDKIMDDSDDKVTDKVDENDSSDKNDVNDSSDVKNDIGDDEVTKDEQKDINSVSKNDNSVCNDDTEGSNNNLSSNNDNSIKDKVNNGTINLNSLSFDYDDGVVISKKNYDVSSPLNKDENENDGSEIKNDENTKIDFENSQDSDSIGGGSDSLLNTQNDKENIDKISIDNATSQSEQNIDVDENKSQSDDNLSQDSKPSEFEEDKSQNNDKETDNSQSSDNITENDHKNAISVIVKTKASTESEELEDSKLMAALDAQIGESNENSRDQISENSKEQISENSQDQINENSGEQINENSLEQTNENSREQINENSQKQINENSREQIKENSKEQTNENSQEQINENSREQIIDNFNTDKLGLEDLITAKNSDLDLIPEEFHLDA